jgi:hypothetical protein
VKTLRKQSISNGQKGTGILYLLLCLFVTVPQQGQASNSFGVMFISGAQSTEQNFSPYTRMPELTQASFVFEYPDASPFTGNHQRDYLRMRESFENLSSRSPAGVVIFAYSVGGKFAARLALEKQEVKGLFLVDPVDGAPPLFGDKDRYPDFLKANLTENLAIPTFILASEQGEQGGFLGIPCVPQARGPKHFEGFISKEWLTFKVISGASHIDFLEPPLTAFAKWGCAPSRTEGSLVRGETQTLWQTFLSQAHIQ